MTNVVKEKKEKKRKQGTGTETETYRRNFGGVLT